MSKNKIHLSIRKDEGNVCFRIGGDNLDPQNISKSLGITPSFAHKKGDFVKGASDKTAKRPSGLWGFESQLPRISEIEKQLTWILNRIEPKYSYIKKILRKRYRMDILVSRHYTADKQCGFTLPAKLVKRLGKLGIEINFDIYTYQKKE